MTYHFLKKNETHHINTFRQYKDFLLFFIYNKKL